MSSPDLISSQTALVTGASRGIGKAIALSLAEAGAEVIVNYSSSSEQAEQVVGIIKKLGGRAYALKANISDETSVNQLIEKVLKTSGKIDILVNNAGITKDGLLMRMKAEDW